MSAEACQAALDLSCYYKMHFERKGKAGCVCVATPATPALGREEGQELKDRTTEELG